MGPSSGLEEVDRHLRPRCVRVSRPEDFPLRLENLVQHGSRLAGLALSDERHGEFVLGLQGAGMIRGQGAGPGGEDVPEYCFCLGDLALLGDVMGEVMHGGQCAGVLGAQDPPPGVGNEAGFDLGLRWLALAGKGSQIVSIVTVLGRRSARGRRCRPGRRRRRASSPCSRPTHSATRSIIMHIMAPLRTTGRQQRRSARGCM